MRISTADFIKNFGAHADQALAAPVTITKHGRDRFVILSAEAYERLASRGRGGRRLKDLGAGDSGLFAVAEAQTAYLGSEGRRPRRKV